LLDQRQTLPAKDILWQCRKSAMQVMI